MQRRNHAYAISIPISLWHAGSATWCRYRR